MKAFAILIMLVALYFLYRIAYPPKAQKNGEISEKQELNQENAENNAVGKSRYVRPAVSQPRTTRTAPENSVNRDQKTSTFAVENEKSSDAVIPIEKLDGIFGASEPETENKNVDENDLDIEKDETESVDLDADEEAEELRQTLGHDADLDFAGGFSIEEMSAAISCADNPDNEQIAVLYELSKTDMFEQLVSGDAGRALF